MIPRRIAIFAIGLCLAGVAHVCVQQREPVADFSLLTAPQWAWLHESYRFNQPNLDNALVGGVLLLCSVALCAWGAAAMPFPQARLLPAPTRITLPTPQRNGWVVLLANLALLPLAYLVCQVSHGSYNHMLPVVWLLVLAVGVLAALLIDRANGNTTLSPNIEWADGVALLLLLALGVAIGTYRLQTLPASMIDDEGGFWIYASSIHAGRFEPVAFDLLVYTFPALSSIYQAWVLDLAGATLWAWRFSSVLAGVVAVVPLYLLARELFDRRVAVVAGVLLLVMPFFLAFARMGYNNAQALLPVTLTLYLLWAGLRRGSGCYLFLAGVAAGMGFYTYTGGRMGLVVALLFLFYLLVVALWRGRAALVAPPRPSDDRGLRFAQTSSAPQSTAPTIVILGMVFLTGAILTVLPLVIYTGVMRPNQVHRKMLENLYPVEGYANTVFAEEELYRDYPPLQIGRYTFFYRPDLYAKLLVRGGIRSLLAFHHPHMATQHYIASAIPGPLGTLFYTAGLGVALAHIRRPAAVLLLVWLLSSIVLLSVIHTFPPRFPHLVPVAPVVALLSALGIVALARGTLANDAGRGEDLGATAGRRLRGGPEAGLPRRETRIRASIPTPEREWRREPAAPPRRAWHTLLSYAIITGCVAAVALSGLHNYLVEVPQRYPPTMRDIIGFTAINAQTPQHLVLVTSEPDSVGFVGDSGEPWMMEHFATRADFQMVQPAALQRGGLDIAGDEGYVFFFFATDHQSVQAFLETAFGTPLSLRVHRNHEGDIIGYSYATDPEVFVPH